MTERKVSARFPRRPDWPNVGEIWAGPNGTRTVLRVDAGWQDVDKPYEAAVIYTRDNTSASARRVDYMDEWRSWQRTARKVSP